MNASGYRSSVRRSELPAWPVARATRFAGSLWFLAVALAPICGSFSPARAGVVIDWVTVGDPGNVGETRTYTSGGTLTFGAVDEVFKIMKYEFTYDQYIAYLNAIDPDGTNPNGVYQSAMAITSPTSPIRGGISRNLALPKGERYFALPNMGNKPVTTIDWWRAARVANWLHNGQPILADTDASATAPQNYGAYSVGTATSGNIVAKNPGALYSLPTEDQWYKAAFYKGGGTDAGYWSYPTQSDVLPVQVTANSVGDGSAGPTGNFANYNNGADWGSVSGTPLDGNLTTVGTSGGSSAYGTFDMAGNLWEAMDPGSLGTTYVVRGGRFATTLDIHLASGFRSTPLASNTEPSYGFRLVTVPEPSTWAAGLAAIACGAWRLRRRVR